LAHPPDHAGLAWVARAAITSGAVSFVRVLSFHSENLENPTHVSSSTPGGAIVTGSVQVGFLALFKQQWRLLAPLTQQKTPRPPLKQQSGKASSGAPFEHLDGGAGGGPFGGAIVPGGVGLHGHWHGWQGVHGMLQKREWFLISFSS
jgi:hypothetical protein